MPKKSRKSKIREKTRRDSDMTTGIPRVVTPRTQPTSVSVARPPRQGVAEIQSSERHEYVRLDLKRSIIVGGSVLALLIIISLLLR